jgi:hypothetical protein
LHGTILVKAGTEWSAPVIGAGAGCDTEGGPRKRKSASGKGFQGEIAFSKVG